MVYKLLGFCMVFLLCSCASKIPAIHVELDSKEVCCDSFADMTYSEIKKGFKKEFRMENSAVYDFESGKSFFKAFNVAGDFDLELVTYADGAYLTTAQIFWPSVITLDESFNIVRKIDKFPLKKGYQFVSVRGENWGGKLRLIEKEKYIIINTNENLFGKKQLSGAAYSGHTYTTGVGTTVVPGSGSYGIYTGYSPGGVIRVRATKKKSE